MISIVYNLLYRLSISIFTFVNIYAKMITNEFTLEGIKCLKLQTK